MDTPTRAPAPAPPADAAAAGADLAVWAAAAAALAGLGAFAALAAVGFPGEVRETVPFCEGLRPGAIKQPANTWSNLGFVVVGLLVAWRADRDRRALAAGADLPRNPLTTAALEPAVLAVVIVLLGPGSMCLHGANTWWGGKVDMLSMYLWIGFPVAYGARRVLGLGRRAFLAGLVGLWAALTLALFLLPHTLHVFGALVVAVVGLEAWATWRAGLVHDRRWLAAAVGAFLLAFGLWFPSRTDGPLCDPGSLLQGHAAWHLLCAAAIGALYLYYRSERAA